MKKLLFSFVVFASLAHAQVVNNRVARVTFETLSSATTTTTFKVDQLTPSKHTLQVVITGSPAGCSIQLEGTLNGTTWANLSGAQTCTSTVTFHVSDRPVDQVRANVTSLSGGSSPTVAVSYVGVQ